jgi:hypothetical protein
VSGPARPSMYMMSEYALFLLPVLAQRGFCKRTPRAFIRSNFGPEKIW